MLKAADADLTRAFDRALGDTTLFRELWSSSTRTEEERTLLRRLVAANDVMREPDPALHDLVHEGYVERSDDGYRIAVPLFARWIRERA